MSSNDLRNLLQSFCEGNCGTMAYIHEDSKEEDDVEPQQSEPIIDPLISGLLPFDEFT